MLEKPFEKTKNDLVQYCRKIEEEHRDLKAKLEAYENLFGRLDFSKLRKILFNKENYNDCDCSGE